MPGVILRADPPTLWVGREPPPCLDGGEPCRTCYHPGCPLWDYGADLAIEYVTTFPGPRADEIRGRLADWLDDNSDLLALPDRVRPLVGAAVRGGCPDVIGKRQTEVTT